MEVVVVVVPLGNYFFTVFCGGPLVVETPGQLPSLPPSPLNPTLLLLLSVGCRGVHSIDRWKQNAS